MNPKVDKFLNEVGNWQLELTKLRSIILETGLTEDFKWKHPCYTYEKANIVLIHGFKDYCAVLFYKGVLLKDKKKLLIQQTENVQTGRQMRFNNISEIIKLEKTIKEYIFESIEAEKAGLKIELKKTSDYETPNELKSKLKKDKDFKAAFENLTPGRQRGYLLHFAQPKQSKTRVDRIEKSAKRIFMGKGLMDCICGHSKRYPNCDGSHKNYVE
ncbi:MAG: YdeI/OmpD-associated family protein [Ignavibacteriales bacterium]|nr:YdeI/OmpD-associated family protein [Ignavibacteriales bacterium]